MYRLLILALALFAAPAVAQMPALLPTPASLRPTGEGFVLVPGTPMIADDRGARGAAARLGELMASRNVALPIVRESVAPVAVRFVRTAGMRAESYRLTTSPAGATITASDDAGLIYGAVTLWQLASADASGRVAGVVIEDRPRFAWRGLMLDSARHFQSPAFVRRLIDWMYTAKLNRLHWHLVDDQGWRLPVPGYPRLTSVSAWRRPATAPGAPPLPRIGGFYTAAQIRELVAYAAARGITIVPEIEMPGHALAAIRAYPQFGMGVAVPPGTEAHWGVFPWLYNTQEPTLRFLEAVLAQTMRLFPSPWIHVGGDEAVKDQWRASAAIQAQIRRLGVKDENALQGWFMARIGRYLAAHDRRLIGWDEILDADVPTGATITSWRGVEGASRAARRGHDAILSPAPTLYLDNRQGVAADEPPGRGNLVTPGDVLAFEPMPAGLSPAQQEHILGLQANLWTEHVRTEARAAWMMFPRALAIAETGWAPAPQRDVTTFAGALVPQLDRLRALGLTAADSAFAVTARIELGAGNTTVALNGQSGLPIRYTLDGSVPTGSAARYVTPLSIVAGQRLRATTFLGDRALAGSYDGHDLVTAARSRSSRQLSSCTQKVLLDVEDDWPATGPRAHFLVDIFNPCWVWSDPPPARRIALLVGQLPFNFQVGADRDKIRFRPPATPAGEFEVRAGCDGPVMATLPLASARGNPGVTRLEAPLPAGPRARDLCITYTARGVDPLWAVQRIDLLP